MDNFINDHDERGLTRLHTAALEGRAALVRDLLTRGADPNIRDAGRFGYTPAILSVQLGDVRVVEEFTKDWRTDWNKRDYVGLSAKHYAAAAAIPLRLLSGQKSDAGHVGSM